MKYTIFGLTLCVLGLLITFFLPVLILPEGGDYKSPFDIGRSYVLFDQPLKQGDEFEYGLYIMVVRPVYNMKIKVIVPKEVEVLKYDIGTTSDMKKTINSVEGPFKDNKENVYVCEGDIVPYVGSSWWEDLTGKRQTSGKGISFRLKTKTVIFQEHSPTF